MRIDVEDALMMLAPCEGCCRTDCLWCRMVWQASVDGYIDDDAFIDCGKMNEIFERIRKDKGYGTEGTQEIQEGRLHDRVAVH